MALLQTLRPTLPILIGASLMLTLSMGLRQSFGIFMQPLTHDIGISISQFTLALAVQNLAWGFLQPVAGAMTVRYGFRPIMIAGSVMYILGLALMATAHGMIPILIGAGVLIGASLACTANAIAMSVAARAVPATVRSTVMGMVSAAGSLGALVSAPVGQLLNEGFGWRVGVAGFVILSLFMLPAAWYAGRADKIPLPPKAADDIGDASAGTAAKTRVRQRFLHGDDLRLFRLRHAAGVPHHAPAVLSRALRHGSDAERADARHDRRLQRARQPVLRLGRPALEQAGAARRHVHRPLDRAGLVFHAAADAGGTLVFGAIMGFLWMGVGPLVAGAVAEMFGLKWQAMIQGLAFMSHQLGSFLGAYGGGLIYDALGSYTMAWRVGVALGLAGGIIQVAFALIRPSEPPRQMQTA